MNMLTVLIVRRDLLAMAVIIASCVILAGRTGLLQRQRRKLAVYLQDEY